MDNAATSELRAVFDEPAKAACSARFGKHYFWLSDGQAAKPGKIRAQRLWPALPYAMYAMFTDTITVRLARRFFLGLVVFGFSVLSDATEVTASLPRAGELLTSLKGASPPEKQAAPAVRPKRANFGWELASQESRNMADWIVDSGDNSNLPFLIVDKAQAKVFVFHADGQLRGAASALLGLAIGDDAVAGIGDRKLSTITPDERTTPAGRFVASLGRNIHGVEILWVDYDNAISLHRVVTSKPKERRAERLASATALDNRISYGCINVPVKFYTKVVSPAFTGTNGIVYVLPETRPATKVFGSYDVDEYARPLAASQASPVQVLSHADR